MHEVTTIYVDGAFVTPHGSERVMLHNPTSREFGAVRLGDRDDTHAAVAAAKRAYPSFSRTSVAERRSLLDRLAVAVAARADDLAAVMMEELAHLPDWRAHLLTKR